MSNEMKTEGITQESLGSQALERTFNGLVKENPTFVLMLGMCPTLAVTTQAINGLGMGLTTTAVLVLSNVLIALLRNVIPNKIRIPAFIVIIATLVTVVELLLEGFIPSLYDALGLYIPLIVVNCIILGRAEAYASKNPVIPSFFDGLGMGLGFTCALTLIGIIREILGAGEIFGFHIMPAGYEPISIFVMAPGAFFVLAALVALLNKIKMCSAPVNNKPKVPADCMNDCLNCTEGGCAKKFYDPDAVDKNKSDVKKADDEKKEVVKKDDASEEKNNAKDEKTEVKDNA